MTNYNLQEVDFFNIQLLLSALTIGTIMVSMVLTYNEKLGLEEKEQILTPEEVDSILVVNRSIVVLIGIGFLLLNISNRKVKENDGKINLKYADLQISASTLTLIASFIVLYVALNDSNQPIISTENPQL